MAKAPKEAATTGRGGLVSAACLALTVLSLLAALNSYQASSLNARQAPDPFGIARAEARFEPLLSKLAADTQLGYITDLEPSHRAHAPMLLAAQYWLAPRELFLLGEGKRPDWAIGNFSRQVDYAAAGAAKGYELNADLGNGIVLFRRKGQ